MCPRPRSPGRLCRGRRSQGWELMARSVSIQDTALCGADQAHHWVMKCTNGSENSPAGRTGDSCGCGERQGEWSRAGNSFLFICLLLFVLFLLSTSTSTQNTHWNNHPPTQTPRNNKPPKAPFHTQDFEAERYKFSVIKRWISTNEYYTMGKNMWKDTEGRWKKDNDSHRVKRKVGKV